MKLKLKVDDKGAAVLEDGKPVFVGDDGKEEPIDVADLRGKYSKLSGDLDRMRPEVAKAKELEQRIAALGEFGDPAKVKALQDEHGKLQRQIEAAKHGTTDEAVEKLVSERYGRKLEDETAKVTSMETKWQEETILREKTEERLRERAIDSEVSIVAGALGGFIPEAIEDARIQARQTFRLNKDGDPEARDSNGGPIFGPDGKTPLTIKDWLASTRSGKPHWWKAGVNGSGVNAGDRQAGSPHIISRANASDPAKYRAAKAAAEKSGVSLQIEG